MRWCGWIAAAALVLAAPAWAESYTIEPDAESQTGFSVGFTFGTVRGAFEEFDGKAELEQGRLVSVTGSAQAASINTNNNRRDGHLRSDHFFHVSKYPGIAFRSTAVQPGADGEIEVRGDLTMRGVTREALLKGTLQPAERERFAFRATGKVNRQDWGIVWNRHLDGMDLLIRDEVTIALEGELVRGE